MQPLVFWPLLAPRRRQGFSLCALLFSMRVYDMREKKKKKKKGRSQPSNLPRGFQRFGFENHFRSGNFSDLGQGLGLLMVKSSLGV